MTHSCSVTSIWKTLSGWGWGRAPFLGPLFTDEDAECIRLGNVHQVPEPGRVRTRTCTQATKRGRARGEGMEWGCSHTRRAGQARQGMTGEQRSEGSPGQAREEPAWAHGDTALPFSLNTCRCPPDHPHCQGLHLAAGARPPAAPHACGTGQLSLLEVLASSVREGLCLLLTSCNEGTSQTEACDALCHATLLQSCSPQYPQCRLAGLTPSGMPWAKVGPQLWALCLMSFPGPYVLCARCQRVSAGVTEGRGSPAWHPRT